MTRRAPDPSSVGGIAVEVGRWITGRSVREVAQFIARQQQRDMFIGPNIQNPTGPFYLVSDVQMPYASFRVSPDGTIATIPALVDRA